MADRYGRHLTMRICVVVAAVTSALLPFSVGSAILLWPVLFFAGGTVAGIYTLGIVLIGQDFRSQKLAVISTGFAMSYSAGCIVGSAPIGYLIDVFGPEALPVSIAIGFFALTIYLFTSGYERDRPEVVADVRAIPQLAYFEDGLIDEEVAAPVHLSEAQLASKWAPVYGSGNVEPRPVAVLPPPEPKPVDDRYRHEHNLEAWFRHRAIEIAEIVAARQKPGGGRPGTRAIEGPIHAPSPFRPPAKRRGGGGGQSNIELI
jgi:hypothetical protein